MKIENTVKMFKSMYPEFLILVKIGTFYHAYGKDTCILSYLFSYQVKKVQCNYSSCGFPVSALERVEGKLDELQVNYIVIDKSEDYNVTEKQEYNTENQYANVYNKAYNYISKKNRVDSIYQFLLESISEENIKDKIVRIEEIIYETR